MLPLLNSFFEIQFVEDQEPFYQLGNLPVYKLKVTRWEYANEQINTGNEILRPSRRQIHTRPITTQINFRVWSRSINRCRFNYVRRLHDYSTGQPALLMQETFVTANIQTQSPYASNLDLNTEAGYDTVSTADDILDFTERNPFGEVDE